MAVHGEELYACDFQASQVQVLNRCTGRFDGRSASPGGEPGQFVRPLGISVDGQGNVYVMDVMKCQLQKFDPDGKFVSNFGTITARAGGSVRPKHIDVDRDGTIYAVDAAFQNVQLFDQSGQVLTFFGSPGTHPGAMYLPAGVCVHEGDLELFKNKIHPAFQAERLVLVTNQFGPNKVSVYAMGHLRPGKTVQDIASSQGLIPAGVDDGKGKGSPAPVVAPSAEPPTAEPPTCQAAGQDEGEGKIVGAGGIGGGSAAAGPRPLADERPGRSPPPIRRPSNVPQGSQGPNELMPWTTGSAPSTMCTGCGTGDHCHGAQCRRRTFQLLVCAAIACLWAGCTAQKKYQVLSIFFDGVPNPDAPRVRPAAGGPVRAPAPSNRSWPLPTSRLSRKSATPVIPADPAPSPPLPPSPRTSASSVTQTRRTNTR